MQGAWGKFRMSQLLKLLPAVALIGCVPEAEFHMAAAQVPPPFQQQQRPSAPAPTPAPQQLRQAHEAALAQRELAARIAELGRSFPGEVGIAVRDVQTDWTTSWNGDKHFPQQSVSKFWVALNVMERVDEGQMDLGDPVTVRQQDLTLFNQPIRQMIGSNGYRTTYGDLLNRSLTQSDNTANDMLLRRSGGPEAVRAMLADKRLRGIRFGPGERLLQAGIAGLSWDDSFSIGDRFYTARAGVPAGRRREAFENYIADPVDGATPIGLVSGLARLQRGELLSAESTRRLIQTMSNTRTGRQRLRGGLAPGWRLAHKTGTGQVLNGTQAGYNDIGILISPEGRTYAVAVMIGRTSVPLPRRMEMMQDVTRATIAYHEALRGTGFTTLPQRTYR